MLKRLIAGLAAVALTGALAFAASITITGTNSEWRNSIFWVGTLRISRDDSIVATPAGTLANSYQITAGINHVITVASAGDAIKLPSTAVSVSGPPGPSGGLQITIINAAAANSLNIFPFAAGDTINAGGAGAAYALAAGKVTTCFVGIDNKWFCNLSA